jgi:Respiratory-chain NADH dehydrogenase, 30 Kd subunit
MISLDTLREKLGISGPWVESRGTHWLNPAPCSVRDVAAVMNAVGARFITITAYELPGVEGFRLEYHWDLDGRLLGFPFAIAGKSVDSIYDLSEAADWIEREVHEGFAIDFTGREYEPLLLRPGDKPGVNLREFDSTAQPASGASAQKEVAQ